MMLAVELPLSCSTGLVLTMLTLDAHDVRCWVAFAAITPALHDAHS